MYDPTNVDPQFRQGPQMSMPPAQQNLPPYLPSTLQIGATTAQSYMLHQGSSSIPAFVYQSDSTIYSHFPCIPVSLTGTLNSSRYTQYFVSGQQDLQLTQNLHCIPSHIAPLTSPNGTEMLHLPPPLPLLGQAPSTDLVYPPYTVGMWGFQNTLHPQCPQSFFHIPSVRLLPLPPPPPYPLERPPLPPSSPLEPPPLPPPSPSPSSPHGSPAASHLLLSSHINQTLSYNLHEGMKPNDLLSRSVQLHNLHEESQHNGSSSRPSQPDSLRNTGVSHLDYDSDVDMEDDITQVADEHIISEQLHEPQTLPARGSLSQSFLCSKSLEEEQMKESNEVLTCNAPSEVLSETYAAADVVGKCIASEPVTCSSPLRLIQDYSADNSSESNHKHCLAAIDPKPVSEYVNVSASDVGTNLSPDLVGNVGSMTLLYDKGFGASESVVACSNLSELAKASTEADQSKDNKHENQELIISGITNKTSLQDAFKGSGIGATPESGMLCKEDEKCMPTQIKVDVFERLVNEGASGSNYDDFGYSRRHGHGGQSQIPSQSPHSRTSQKRKEKRSRSCSRSPKKQRSISPFSVHSDYGGSLRHDRHRLVIFDQVKSPEPKLSQDLFLCNLGPNQPLSHSDDLTENNKAVRDTGIDQVKTDGKRMKAESSRSMKHFKVALTDFVKGVLKPYWREGKMSKVVFKMIVKKTVDKVSGAMENHQIPKSRETIKCYIDSSHRKLTNLVMGYVDKYVRD